MGREDPTPPARSHRGWLGETGPAWHTRAPSDPDNLIAIEAEAPVGYAVPAGLRGDPAIEPRRMVISSVHRRTGRGPALLTAVLARLITTTAREESGWMSRRAIIVPERCMNPKASPPPKLSPGLTSQDE